MDSVEGGSFICWEVFLTPEALTRALKAQASRGVWGRALPPPPPQEIWQIYVLSSAISWILMSFLRWHAFSLNISSSESNCHSKKILKCSEMSVCN